MQTVNLANLEINELTQAQYDALVDAGQIDEDAIYFVPDEEQAIASLTEYGITKLEDSVESTSVETAATPNSVKTAYDLAAEAKETAENKSDKPVVTAATLLAANWSNNIYSFESEYPVAEYNVEVEPDGDSITSDQLDAWMDAQPVGSVTANRIIAMGDVPTVGIPVILKVTKK